MNSRFIANLLPISLAKETVIGRSSDCDIKLDDPQVSRRHLRIVFRDGRFVAEDLQSSTGSRVNGRLFVTRELVYGDRLALGAHEFRFDSQALIPVLGAAGAELSGSHLQMRAGRRLILNDVSVHVRPGEFVGLLGPSGSGKTTLLETLGGVRQATAGAVTFDRMTAQKYIREKRAQCGFVPQDDIVHGELRVKDALRFSARLRLPAHVSDLMIDDAVQRTLEALALDERENVVVSRLSGGQRKRVSIASEVISRPSLLFLDEPSSGLDPATESKLMEQLRSLASLGCTVLCTTHVMENVHLFDRLLVIYAGRLVFDGRPEDAKKHFQISKMTQLYERLATRSVDEWLALAPSHANAAPPPAEGGALETGGPPDAKPRMLRILLERQLALLLADWKTPLVLLGQPLVIGVLTAWMADTDGLRLFLAYLATFWFGCGNAAQEIVRETAVYRRERIVGMGRASYLGAKFLFWCSVTLLQALLLFACLKISGEVHGHVGWQALSLAVTALSATGIGFALSSWVRTTTQAVMLVPLILLPQIIFSGFVMESMNEHGMKRTVSACMPSHASQMIMDTSLVWRRQFSSDLLRQQPVACRNLELPAKLALGAAYKNSSPAWKAVQVHAVWMLAMWSLAWLGCWRKEKA
ncbi:ATP-binding cassette domain-containing protein [Prosthecobacter sp.]|uniref:ATP-binding cassette domain-containing protein n=1 Tax=Prosthecobacter sp. TaxID=1965333 RepID=UPI0037848B6F